MVTTRGIYVVVHGEDRDLTIDKVTDVHINGSIITLMFDAGYLKKDIAFDRITLHIGSLATDKLITRWMSARKGDHLVVVQPLELASLW